MGIVYRKEPHIAASAQKERRVLLVDDNEAQRHLLSIYLKSWGYVIREASSATLALMMLKKTHIDIVICGRMIDGMSGRDLCRHIRRGEQTGYSYFMLSSVSSDKKDIQLGIAAGADDVLIHPICPHTLQLRLKAGERFLDLRAEIAQKDHLLADAVKELETVQTASSRDLIEARQLQQALMRKRARVWDRGAARLFMRPAGHIGGDLVGFFDIDRDRIGLYGIDVSGHGVASAMMTARLAGYLSGDDPSQSPVLRAKKTAARESWPPEDVARRFNRIMIEDMRVDQYCTMAYAEMNMASGRFSMVQAGHPHPLIMRANGEIEALGQGGLPIGLFPDATYERIEAQLFCGDRLLILSDGVTECPSPDGAQLGEDGLLRLLKQSKSLDSRTLLETLAWDLAEYRGKDSFPDDISGLIFDYTGQP